MNVLILTPDAVGSTLLQRILTIYMQFHQFDKPVLNIHELTNGIDRVYSPDFNREIVIKNFDKGYHQKLPEITDILKSADHYIIGRLAGYHIRARQDPVEDQVPFFRYLDDNFFIICTKRRNLFEHGISHAINRITKKLNVYDAHEKLDTFQNMYQTGITISTHTLAEIWDRYVRYLAWCESNFSVGSYYYYEDHSTNIENYILNLPVFAGQQKLIGWKEVYDLEFNDWNRCHYLTSNVGMLLSNSASVQQQIAMSTKQDPANIIVKDDNFGIVAAKDFLDQNVPKYNTVNESIERMKALAILPTGIPIKKQTLAEKCHIVKNFDECLNFYNQWILKYPDIAKPMTKEEIFDTSQTELKNWFAGPSTDLITTS